jgi:hypothetical protein
VSKTPRRGAAGRRRGKKDDKKDKDKGKKTEYAYEDISFVPVTPGRLRCGSRARSPCRPAPTTSICREGADAGEGAEERAAAEDVRGQADRQPCRTSGTTSWRTSSVIVAQRIDPLPAPLTPQQQADRPYALGIDGDRADLRDQVHQEGRAVDLHADLQPEGGQRQQAGRQRRVQLLSEARRARPEKFFNKTNPQNLNAQTLPPNFDFAQGHQLQSGQAVPLASFPEGDYRLEIKITDKIANKTLTREINFTVSPS